MGPLGADVDALDRLAASMHATSRQLGRVAFGLERQCRRTNWSGVDADRFRREWSLRHRPLLLALGDRCTELARSLEHQAAQQRRASRASGTPAPGWFTALVLPRAGTGNGSAGHGSRDRRSPIPAMPLREQRFQGGVDIKAGLVTASLSGDVWIQELTDGRVRLSVAQKGGLGLVAGVGATADFSIGDHRSATTPTSGAKAEARAQVAAVERRTWEVHPDDVAGLLARIAAAESLSFASPAAAFDDPRTPTVIGGSDTRTVARAAGGLVDAVSGFVFGIDPGVDDRLESIVTIPAPERVEALAQVQVAAVVGASLFEQNAPAGQLATSGSLRAGRAASRSGHSTIIEYEGGASATLSAALMGKLGIGMPTDSNASTAVRLELAELPDGRPDHLQVKLSRTSGTKLEETVIRVDLGAGTAHGLGHTVRRFIERLSTGDLSGASHTLAQISSGALSDAVEVLQSSAEISGTTVSGGGSAAAGLSVGFSARGQAVRLDRR